jgi:peptide methionine sulfoxide reductase msrA/msrB
LGHVFNDAPGGKRRFCINATVLEFVPRAEIKKEAKK